jgi:acetylglutamate kinase
MMSNQAGASPSSGGGLPNIFVKVSGDEYQNPKFLDWLKSLSERAWVVVCIGGGTQINAAFKAEGIEPNFGPLGRETRSLYERQLARDVLERNQTTLQDALARYGIRVAVEVPVVYIGTVLCHVNGDQMVRTAYLGFSELYVVTIPDRLDKKRGEFADLEKVQVVAFE